MLKDYLLEVFLLVLLLQEDLMTLETHMLEATVLEQTEPKAIKGDLRC